MAGCQTDEDLQRLAEELLEELRRSDRGFIRGGGATMAAAIDNSEIIYEFIIKRAASPAGHRPAS